MVEGEKNPLKPSADIKDAGKVPTPLPQAARMATVPNSHAEESDGAPRVTTSTTVPERLTEKPFFTGEKGSTTSSSTLTGTRGGEGGESGNVGMGKMDIAFTTTMQKEQTVPPRPLLNLTTSTSVKAPTTSSGENSLSISVLAMASSSPQRGSPLELTRGSPLVGSPSLPPSILCESKREQLLGRTSLLSVTLPTTEGGAGPTRSAVVKFEEGEGGRRMSVSMGAPASAATTKVPAAPGPSRTTTTTTTATPASATVAEGEGGGGGGGAGKTTAAVGKGAKEGTRRAEITTTSTTTTTVSQGGGGGGGGESGEGVVVVGPLAVGGSEAPPSAPPSSSVALTSNEVTDASVGNTTKGMIGDPLHRLFPPLPSFSATPSSSPTAAGAAGFLPHVGRSGMDGVTVIYHDEVYHIPMDFILHDHPGGPDAILAYQGEDISSFFGDHPSWAEARLRSWSVGPVRLWQPQEPRLPHEVSAAGFSPQERSSPTFSLSIPTCLEVVPTSSNLQELHSYTKSCSITSREGITDWRASNEMDFSEREVREPKERRLWTPSEGSTVFLSNSLSESWGEDLEGGREGVRENLWPTMEDDGEELIGAGRSLTVFARPPLCCARWEGWEEGPLFGGYITPPMDTVEEMGFHLRRRHGSVGTSPRGKSLRRTPSPTSSRSTPGLSYHRSPRFLRGAAAEQSPLTPSLPEDYHFSWKGFTRGSMTGISSVYLPSFVFSGSASSLSSLSSLPSLLKTGSHLLSYLKRKIVSGSRASALAPAASATSSQASQNRFPDGFFPREPRRRKGWRRLPTSDEEEDFRTPRGEAPRPLGTSSHWDGAGGGSASRIQGSETGSHLLPAHSSGGGRRDASGHRFSWPISPHVEVTPTTSLLGWGESHTPLPPSSTPPSHRRQGSARALLRPSATTSSSRSSLATPWGMSFPRIASAVTNTSSVSHSGESHHHLSSATTTWSARSPSEEVVLAGGEEREARGGEGGGRSENAHRRSHHSHHHHHHPPPPHRYSHQIPLAERDEPSCRTHRSSFSPPSARVPTRPVAFGTSPPSPRPPPRLQSLFSPHGRTTT